MNHAIKDAAEHFHRGCDNMLDGDLFNAADHFGAALDYVVATIEDRDERQEFMATLIDAMNGRR